MLKKFLRALVIARVGSAAAHVALNMNGKQLAEAGIDRRTFPLEAMTCIEAEFAGKDAQKATA
tara:strand:+ start:275 stop:463 length:189 start_codon:yes stop_codon:yes gene_type:complete